MKPNQWLVKLEQSREQLPDGDPGFPQEHSAGNVDKPERLHRLDRRVRKPGQTNSRSSGPGSRQI